MARIRGNKLCISTLGPAAIKSFIHAPLGWQGESITAFLINSSRSRLAKRSSLNTQPAPPSMADKDITAMHVEDQPDMGISAADAEFLSNLSEEAKRKAVKKVSQPTPRSEQVECRLTGCV